jgi:hypothetical protein
VKINGTTHCLWRAVDQHGDVLDILMQSRRNAVAAKRFFRKLLKGLQYVPWVIVTDQLGSYQVAHRELLPSVTHRRWRYLNRAENSHQPTRIREPVMKRFASPGQAQRFLSAFGGIQQHFRPRRHLISATQVGSRAGAVTTIDGRSEPLVTAGFPLVSFISVALVRSLFRFQLPPVKPCMRFSRTRLTDAVHRRHSVSPARACRPWVRSRFQSG